MLTEGIDQQLEIVDKNEEIFLFPEIATRLQINVDWCTKGFSGDQRSSICDLDLSVYFYDERGRFIEKLDGDLKFSKDKSSELIADIDAANLECVRIQLDKVNEKTCAIALYLDGGIIR